MTNIFDADTDLTGEVDPLEYARAKFRTADGELDVAALARAKMEADKHISKVEAEQATVREELTRRLSFEELAAKIDAAKNPVVEPPVTPGVAPSGVNEKHGMSEEDIAKLVKQTLTQEQQKAVHSSNIDSVRNELAKAWGENYVTKLKEVIADLGYPQQEAEVLAATRPKAFLKMLLGQAAAAPIYNPAPPRSGLMASNIPDTNARNYEFFEKMRKSDPKSYWLPRTQNEMHKLAEKMGEAFYKK